GGALQVGFDPSAGNDKLTVTGDGSAVLNNNPRLIGTGLAGTTAAPVLDVVSGGVTGRFASSVDASDTPVAFLAGSDVVQADYFGDVRVAGPLTSLTAHDVGVAFVNGAAQTLIQSGGPASASSALTLHRVQDARVDLAGVLGTFKAAAVDTSSSLYAQRFGA